MTEPQPDTAAPAARVPCAALPEETSCLTFPAGDRSSERGGWALADCSPLAKELVRRSRPRGKWPRGRAGRRLPSLPGFRGLCPGTLRRTCGCCSWSPECTTLGEQSSLGMCLPSLWLRDFLYSVGWGIHPSTSYLRETCRLLLFLAVLVGSFRWTREISLNVPDWGSHSYGFIPKQGFSELTDHHHPCSLLDWGGRVRRGTCWGV